MLLVLGEEGRSCFIYQRTQAGRSALTGSFLSRLVRELTLSEATIYYHICFEEDFDPAPSRHQTRQQSPVFRFMSLVLRGKHITTIPPKRRSLSAKTLVFIPPKKEAYPPKYSPAIKNNHLLCFNLLLLRCPTSAFMYLAFPFEGEGKCTPPPPKHKITKSG